MVAANDELIAARSAESRKVSKSPFGPDDEIGMMNLMTPQSRARVLAEADGSKMFDLAVEYFHGMPSWTAGGDPPYQLWMTHTPGGEIANGRRGLSPTSDHMVYTSDAFSMFTHCGTHIDTLNHYGYDGQIWNCYTMAQDLGSRSWHVCGAEKHPPILRGPFSSTWPGRWESTCCLTRTPSALTISAPHSIDKERSCCREMSCWSGPGA